MLVHTSHDQKMMDKPLLINLLGGDFSSIMRHGIRIGYSSALVHMLAIELNALSKNLVGCCLS